MEIDSRTDALIVVDVQRDFCPGGALAVQQGDQVVEVVNRLVDRFQLVVFTRDWHPPDHCCFAASPIFQDGSWPAHCVAGTPGAELHPDLRVPAQAVILNKATRADQDAYSGFDGTGLAELLHGREVRRIWVLGLATDYCVQATARDGLAAGFEVWVVVDGCRAVDHPPGTGAQALIRLEQAGVRLAESSTLG